VLVVFVNKLSSAEVIHVTPLTLKGKTSKVLTNLAIKLLHEYNQENNIKFHSLRVLTNSKGAV
jgi:hypothetical protein